MKYTGVRMRITVATALTLAVPILLTLRGRYRDVHTHIRTVMRMSNSRLKMGWKDSGRALVKMRKSARYGTRLPIPSLLRTWSIVHIISSTLRGSLISPSGIRVNDRLAHMSTSRSSITTKARKEEILVFRYKASTVASKRSATARMSSTVREMYPERKRSGMSIRKVSRKGNCSKGGPWPRWRYCCSMAGYLRYCSTIL